MTTLNLRGVPDDVVARLERLAALDGISVNEVAVRELTDVSRRANPALLAELPDTGVTSHNILVALAADRPDR